LSAEIFWEVSKTIQTHEVGHHDVRFSNTAKNLLTLVLNRRHEHLDCDLRTVNLE
jgi:hypothetical protein